MSAPDRRRPGSAPDTFTREIERAIRYERGLAVKAALALLLVAGVLLAHIYLFA